MLGLLLSYVVVVLAVWRAFAGLISLWNGGVRREACGGGGGGKWAAGRLQAHRGLLPVR